MLTADTKQAARGILKALLTATTDDFLWGLLHDWCEEHLPPGETREEALKQIKEVPQHLSTRKPVTFMWYKPAHQWCTEGCKRMGRGHLCEVKPYIWTHIRLELDKLAVEKDWQGHNNRAKAVRGLHLAAIRWALSVVRGG